MNRGLLVIAFLFVTLAGLNCSYDSDSKLLKNLESDNSGKRLYAAQELRLKKKTPELMQKLFALLESKNDQTVFITAQVLQVSDSTAVPALSRLIHHPNAAVREQAIASLGLVGFKESAPYLIEALGDSSSAVRYMASKMLGMINAPSVVSSLYPMLRDEVDSVRVITVQSIFMYHLNPEADIRAADFAIAMRDQSDRVRWVATQALSEVYPDTSIGGALLIEGLKDSNKQIRLQVIKGLGKIKYMPAVQPLKDMFDLATVDEEMEITKTIQLITGEEYPLIDAEGLIEK